jgi:propanol-preferring alcohol dehydrogenase
MKAMVLRAPRLPLELTRVDHPRPGPGQVLVKVHVCGVCRTDLHVIDGELPHARSPVIPGHEIVGTVAEVGAGVTALAAGDRVGVPWLGFTCGVCRYCRAGDENLCDAPQFTGYTIDGGYAEYAVDEGRELFAFTRPGDIAAQNFARELGAVWAGGSDERTPEELDAAILLAPVGALVPRALRDVVKGGVVVCGGIHMTDIPQFPYEILWGERRICSVANLTRQDGRDFIELAQRVPVRTTVTPYPLARANEALAALREGALTGAAVLTMT